MLANHPLQSPHTSPPSFQQHEQQPSDYHPDPFQSLYDSLANLNLNFSTTTNITTTPSSFSANTNTNLTPTSQPNSNTIPNPSSSSSPPSNPPPPPPPAPLSLSLSPDLIPVTPLFPPGPNAIFAHSSFFRRHPNANAWLPSPADVRAEAARLGLIAPAAAATESMVGLESSVLVPFCGVGLMVKWHRSWGQGHGQGHGHGHGMGMGGRSGWGEGGVLAAAEGKAMMLLRSVLPAACAEVVPEVFGWRADEVSAALPGMGAGIEGGEEGFVYMAMPDGEVLGERWAGMSEGEKEGVCAQLREVVGQWRRLRLGGVGFVGSVDNGPVPDQIFQACKVAGAPPPGPFPTVSAFHDYFVSMAVTVSQSKHDGADAGQVRYTPHHLFPDDVSIVFTHGGLHPRNIVISRGPYPRVVAILGWEQAGWYPAYWELCKARWECSRRGSCDDWVTNFLPWVLDSEGPSQHMRGWHTSALCQYWDYFAGLM